jgi:hypothetical protein
MLNVVLLSVIVVGVMAPISNVKIWPKENAQSLDILVQQKMFYNVETSQQNFPGKNNNFLPKNDSMHANRLYFLLCATLL